MLGTIAGDIIGSIDAETARCVRQERRICDPTARPDPSSTS
jgi:hypothetical protein